MTDIHNHLLFDIDDGARTVEESIACLKDMSLVGYKNVILTPHYIVDSSYSSSRKEALKKLKELQEAVDLENIDIKLYLGNEIYIDEDISKLKKKGIISSLNNTNYLLIELPFDREYPDYEAIFKDLIDEGYCIVLAHPERYHIFQNDYKKLCRLHRLGIVFQSNLDSITGGYGHSAEKLVKKLLREGRITFLATDLHRKRKNYDSWKKAKDIALKYMSDEEFNKLVDKNPSMFIH